MGIYMFQEWLFQNGLESADIHLEYLVSNFFFSEPKVSQRRANNGKFYDEGLPDAQCSTSK